MIPVMEIATQIIIFIVALCFSAGILALVIVLVPTIKELKNLLVDLQKTSAEVRAITEDIKKISSNVEGKIESFDGIFENSKQIAANVDKAFAMVNSSFGKHAEWLTLIPAALVAWKAISTLLRRKDEQQ
jgi:predicted PurR-regulated permease PerM